MRLEAWFRTIEVQVTADRHAVAELAQRFETTEAQALAALPAQTKRQIEDRRAHLETLLKNHMNIDELMGLTQRETERNVFRSELAEAERQHMTVGELAQKELVKKQQDREAKDRAIDEEDGERA